jgi:hypothetical protein
LNPELLELNNLKKTLSLNQLQEGLYPGLFLHDDGVEVTKIHILGEKTLAI